MRAEATESTFMVSTMVNPPQGSQFKQLTGNLLPTSYPFNYNDMYLTRNYFWLKYYVSQRTFLAIPMRPTYANWEVLINVMNTNVIDLS